jgi:hypothetical protein
MCTYSLTYSLTHSSYSKGDVGGGHYYAYIRPSEGFSYSPDELDAQGLGGKWFKFDDETVLKVKVCSFHLLLQYLQTMSIRASHTLSLYIRCTHIYILLHLIL